MISLMLATAAAVANLIANSDLSFDDGVGTPMVGWSVDIRDKRNTSVKAWPTESGAFAIQANGVGYASLQQTNIGLVPGAKYRLSYDVRTAGLKGLKPHFYMCDGHFSWSAEQTGPNFPDDTKGTWAHQEATFTALEGSGETGHTLRIDCLGVKPKEITFEIRNLRFEALDQDVAAKSKPRICPGGLKSRIVPVDPLVTAVDPNKGKMKFYWPANPSCGRTNCTLVAKIDGGREVAAALCRMRGHRLWWRHLL